MYVSLLRLWYLVLRTMRRAKNYQRKRIVADDYDAVLEILSFWNKKFRKRFRLRVSARVCSKVAISRDSPTPPLFNHRL